MATNAERLRADSARVRRIRWSVLRPEFLARWEPGEHVGIVGPTGSGKSTIMLNLLEGRAERRGASVVVLATKRRDPLLARLGRKVILWPPYPKASQANRNAGVFRDALDEILDEGGWTVAFDEAIYFTE